MIQIVFIFRDLRLREYLVLLSERNISTLSEKIKLCKLFIAKRISYIISWSFDIHVFERIKYLRKIIKIKGWVPVVRNDKLISCSYLEGIPHTLNKN
ncbi:hypothetical protein H5410_021341 [Solanum commersonii]|uniref:Uncharacterized protein n=1 Tax=Solanum commersonii TaxID=4109 RepID=A0A9J5ZEV5_SOLCO|nr:hypothetical protein H5410_021341 [Solanum commersonii]